MFNPLKHNIVTFVSLTVIVLCSVIFMETDYMWFVVLAIFLLYLGITAYGSYQIQANYFIKSVNKGKKSVALTFDDGPDPETTPRILEILREKKVKATFFIIGKKAEKYPDLLRQIYEDGHIIANHSYSHNYLIAFFSTSRLTKDLQRCNEFILQTIGKKPAFFVLHLELPIHYIMGHYYKPACNPLGGRCVAWIPGQKVNMILLKR